METQESLLVNPSFPSPSSDNKFCKIAPKKHTASKKSALNLLEESVSLKNHKPNSFDYSIFNKKKYKIFYNFPETEEILKIEIDFSNEDAVENAIPNILIKFNEKFKDEHFNFRFDTSKTSSFELLLASKSGKGKATMPCIDKNQILAMTGMCNFALIDKEESKRSVKRTKDLYSIESKETYWPNESVENDVFFKENQMRNESFVNAKRTYTNSLINMREDRNKEAENNNQCLNYCKFSFCK